MNFYIYVYMYTRKQEKSILHTFQISGWDVAIITRTSTHKESKTQYTHTTRIHTCKQKHLNKYSHTHIPQTQCSHKHANKNTHILARAHTHEWISCHSLAHTSFLCLFRLLSFLLPMPPRTHVTPYPPTQLQRHVQTRTLTQTHKHTYIQKHKKTYIITLEHEHTCTHTRTHDHNHTQAHTNTPTPISYHEHKTWNSRNNNIMHTHVNMYLYIYIHTYVNINTNKQD